MPDSITPCEFARERYYNRALWRNLWTILLFIFGAAVVLFLIAAIVYFIRENWLPTTLSILGTIVQGVAIKWVLDRRNEAVREEEEAYKDVKEACQDTAHPDAMRKQLALFSRFR